jgi:hypothetical protein
MKKLFKGLTVFFFILCGVIAFPALVYPQSLCLPSLVLLFGALTFYVLSKLA